MGWGFGGACFGGLGRDDALIRMCVCVRERERESVCVQGFGSVVNYITASSLTELQSFGGGGFSARCPAWW